MDKFTAHYSTLPIHTVAYHCDDDRSVAFMVAIACQWIVSEAEIFIKFI